MERSNIADIWPLTPMQQGMLLHTLEAEPGSGAYVQQLVFALGGELEEETFAEAWRQVIARHSSLRALFVWEDRKEPLQVICRDVLLPWRREDWRKSGDPDEKLQNYLDADRAQGFDLKRAPLMRCLLARTADGWRFVWSFHHLLMDGWCLSTLFREAVTIYEAFRQGEEVQLAPEASFKRYLGWLQQQDSAEALAYWKRELAGFRAPLHLAIETEEAGEPGSYVEREIRLDTDRTQAVQEAAARGQVTVGALVQGAWACLLARYTETDDVVFGLTQSGRPPALPDAESMVGVFINTVPVRVRTARRSLGEVARNVFDGQFARQENAHAPLAEIQRVSDAPGGVSLFETLVVFENYPIDRSGLPDGLELHWARGHDQTNYPLTLLVMPDRELTLRLVFDAGRFTPATVERILGHLSQMLQAAPENWQTPADRLPLLADAERENLRQANATERDYPVDATLCTLLAEQAARTPDATALRADSHSLSYAELDARVTRVAGGLLARGVGPGAVVGVHMERSIDLVVALHAVVRAGAAYLALDPAYPAERLRFMAADADVTVTLISAPSDTFPSAVLLDDIATPAPRPLPPVEPDDAVYVLYTSGSTGRPKGVVNTHRAIVNRLLWMQETFTLTPADVVLQKTPYSFDVSVWEFFWPLIAGATLAVAKPDGHKDPEYLAETISAHGVTTMHFVPSMLNVFLPFIAECEPLKRVICSGEALPNATVDEFFAQSTAELHNLYGPTEAAIDVTWHRCLPGEPRTPIGKAIGNTTTYVLNAALEQQPVGVAGDLYLGGVQLARGYLGRPALTADRFRPDPFSTHPGARLYATGDRARRLPDGALEYLGRSDFQVKVRGFRVELGEIEARLETHPGVARAVVTSYQAQEGERLAAYVVPSFFAKPDTTQLGAYLRETLPDYMTPSAWTFLDALPLNANGKVDRKVLPAPGGGAPTRQHELVEPRSENERAIAAIWRDILELEQVGVRDNFFDLGGNSLLLVPIHQRLKKDLGSPLSLAEMFRYPTIETLAAKLADPAPLPPPQPEPPTLRRNRLAAQRAARRNAKAGV